MIAESDKPQEGAPKQRAKMKVREEMGINEVQRDLLARRKSDGARSLADLTNQAGGALAVHKKGSE